MAAAFVACSSEREQDYRYALALLSDTGYATMENLPPTTQWLCPQALKASKKHDPDTPTYREAMNGPHREEFEKAMDAEVDQLRKHKTWTGVKLSHLPAKANVLPGTWAFKVKRYPDGRFRKFKARFCDQGDRQIEGVDYFKKYAPVVSWSTVRLMLVLAASCGLETQQVFVWPGPSTPLLG